MSFYINCMLLLFLFFYVVHIRWNHLYSEKCLRPKYLSLSPPEFVQVQLNSQLQFESKYPTLDFMHKLNNSFSVLLNTQNNQYRCSLN